MIAKKSLGIVVLLGESEYSQKKHYWQLLRRQICQGIGTQQHKQLAHQGYFVDFPNLALLSRMRLAISLGHGFDQRQYCFLADRILSISLYITDYGSRRHHSWDCLQHRFLFGQLQSRLLLYQPTLA